MGLSGSRSRAKKRRQKLHELAPENHKAIAVELTGEDDFCFGDSL